MVDGKLIWAFLLSFCFTKMQADADHTFYVNPQHNFACGLHLKISKLLSLIGGIARHEGKDYGLWLQQTWVQSLPNSPMDLKQITYLLYVSLFPSVK